MPKTKIVIAGIGGVGGYFGGMLAKHYEKNPDIEIYFLARGEHLAAIKKHGLKLIVRGEAFTCKPTLATDNATDCGEADFVLITTKNYDLENIALQLKPCINRETILLPLLNGVEATKRLQSMYPENIIVEGCVHIISRICEAGVVENSGNIQKLAFGLDNTEYEKMNLLQGIFLQSGLQAVLSKNISSLMWEKFIFISPTATATSYFNKSIGQLTEDEECLQTVTALIEEVKQLAQKKNIAIAADITEKTLQALRAIPYEHTSSMHRDFMNKKPSTELESLTGYVVRQGELTGTNTPVYAQLYDELKKGYN